MQNEQNSKKYKKNYFFVLFWIFRAIILKNKIINKLLKLILFWSKFWNLFTTFIWIYRSIIWTRKLNSVGCLRRRHCFKSLWIPFLVSSSIASAMVWLECPYQNKQNIHFFHRTANDHRTGGDVCIDGDFRPRPELWRALFCSFITGMCAYF